ncbi:hypothetical protein RQP46_011289 [Phenoliferia psychrophenolica]
MSSEQLNIGVLALQGGFTEHLHLLSLLPKSLNLSLTQIRTPAQLALVSGLIIPGGESTTIALLAKQAGLTEPLREFAQDARAGRNGRTIWGTCAGMILLSEEVVGTKEGYEGVGGVDVKVVRNQYGRQAESFRHPLELSILPSATPFEAIFIRAPILHSILPPVKSDINAPVEVIARVPLSKLPACPKGSEPLGPDADVVMARQGNLVLSSFHPELGGDTRVHEWWIRESTMSAAPNGTSANGNGAAAPLYHLSLGEGTFGLKSGLAQMLKGGVIMDVVNVEEALIAEAAGACAVMALERVPSDIRRDGGVARMDDPKMIKEIMAAVSIPVMAKSRIGHFVEAQILQAVGVDYIDESEVLSLADPSLHVDKHSFKVPFVCGCKDLGEALRRIHEGAAMIRTKGEAGTGNIIEAVRHARMVNEQIRKAQGMTNSELYNYAKELSAPYELLKQVSIEGRLPVVMFSAGGIATPADAALMMQLGCDGVFVGSGIFKSSNPALLAKAIVVAVTNYNDPHILADICTGLGRGMKGEGNLRVPGVEMTADRGC